VAVFRLLLVAAAGALEAGAAALEVPELVELVELPQAVIISAASPAGARGLRQGHGKRPDHFRGRRRRSWR
jgi:hypothetical protein